MGNLGMGHVVDEVIQQVNQISFILAVLRRTRVTNDGAHLRKKITAVASSWRHWVRLDRPQIPAPIAMSSAGKTASTLKTVSSTR